jgi:hypothetical protein
MLTSAGILEQSMGAWNRVVLADIGNVKTTEVRTSQSWAESAAIRHIRQGICRSSSSKRSVKKIRPPKNLRLLSNVCDFQKRKLGHWERNP